MGIDLSLTRSGVAIVDTERAEVVLATRVISPGTGSSAKQRRSRIRKAVDGVLKYVPQGVDLVVIEEPLPPVAGKASLQIERAGAYWMLLDQLIPRVPVAEVNPRTRAKLATGSGNASKADVRDRVRSDFPGLRVADDNVADAVALVAAGARRVGTPLVEYSAKQQEAYTTVVWPEGI